MGNKIRKKIMPIKIKSKINCNLTFHFITTKLISQQAKVKPLQENCHLETDLDTKRN